MIFLNEEQLLRDWRGPEPEKHPNNNWINEYARDIKSKERNSKLNKIINKIKLK